MTCDLCHATADRRGRVFDRARLAGHFMDAHGVRQAEAIERARRLAAAARPSPRPVVVGRQEEPAPREKMRAALQRPEVREKRRAALQRPEVREKMRAGRWDSAASLERAAARLLERASRLKESSADAAGVGGPVAR